MTEAQSANPEPFSLLSEGVQKVIESGDELRLPVLTSWILRNIPRPILVLGEKTALFEEEELLGAMPNMLQEADRVFTTTPASVGQLKTSYDNIKGREDDYLRFALVKQRREYERWLKTLPEGNLEKKLNNILRGLKNKERNVQEITEEIRQNRECIERYVKDVAISALLILELEEENRTRGLRESIEALRRCAEATKIMVEWEKKIAQATQEISYLRTVQLSLEQDIERKKTIQSILAQTRARLAELGITETPTKQPSMPPPIPSMSPVSQLPSSKRKHGNGTPANGVPQNGTNGTSEKNAMTPSQKPDPIAIAVKKIKEVIQDQPKIRILVGQNHNRRFKNNWEKVLKQLGFSGIIEMVFYEDLVKTSDRETVVLVPRGMNTHYNIGWRKNQEHIVIIHIHETIILNYLNVANSSQIPSIDV